MSADGNLKFTFVPQAPSTSHKPKVERTCPLCKLPLRGDPAVLLKTGQSIHVECYFRRQKHSREDRAN